MLWLCVVLCVVVVLCCVLERVFAMTNGPIEYLGETFVDEKPDSEYGGSGGLLQPDNVGEALSDGMKIGHELTPSERAGVMARRANVGLSSREAWTGESDYGEEIVDPATGRALTDEEVGLDVTGKPGREHGLTEGTWQ